MLNLSFITPSPFWGGGIYMFHLRNKSYLESVHQVSPDFKDHQWLLKADPMDPSLPFLGRKHKFCLYNSYLLVQDYLWIQQPYEVFLHLPVLPYGPLYRLFYKGRGVYFQLEKILHLCAYRNGDCSNLFHHLLGLQQPESRTMSQSLLTR